MCHVSFERPKSTKTIPTCNCNLLMFNGNNVEFVLRMANWLKTWSSSFQGHIQWPRLEDLTNWPSTSKREFSNTNSIRTWRSNNPLRYLSRHCIILNTDIQFLRAKIWNGKFHKITKTLFLFTTPPMQVRIRLNSYELFPSSSSTNWIFNYQIKYWNFAIHIVILFVSSQGS